MSDMTPSDAEIGRLLAQAAAESARHSGADELAAHSALLVERSRRMATLSMQFDIMKTVALLALVVFLAVVFRGVLKLG